MLCLPGLLPPAASSSTAQASADWVPAHWDSNMDWIAGHAMHAGVVAPVPRSTMPGGVACVFPFTYRGHSYSTCITTHNDNQGNAWCATTASYDTNASALLAASLYYLTPQKLV